MVPYMYIYSLLHIYFLQMKRGVIESLDPSVYPPGTQIAYTALIASRHMWPF